MAALLHETARAYFFNHRLEEALPLCHRALALAEQLGLVEVQADALATLGILPNQPREASRQALTQAVELAESAGLLYIAARAHVNLAGRLEDEGDLRAARTHFQCAHELARQMGLTFWELGLLDPFIWLSLMLGNLAEADEALRLMHELEARSQVPGRTILWSDTLQAQLWRYQGQWDEALPLLQAGRERARQMGEEKRLVGFDLVLADTLYEVGRLEEAEAVLAEALDSAGRAQDERAWQVRCLLSTVYGRQGRAAEAAQLLEQARAQACDHPSPADQGLLDWTAARLAVGERRYADALAALEQASQAAARLSMRWHHARVLQDMAEVRLARGEEGDLPRARELLTEALAIFRQLPAPGYVALLEERLRAIAG
jgi:tetratricopeptide (TPR) repeat protein